MFEIYRLTTPVLKQICAVLDLERNGVKDEVVNRVIEFLMEPKDSGKSLPAKKSECIWYLQSITVSMLSFIFYQLLLILL